MNDVPITVVLQMMMHDCAFLVGAQVEGEVCAQEGEEMVVGLRDFGGGWLGGCDCRHYRSRGIQIVHL